MEKVTDKLFNWASILDPNTLAQAKLASTMPFVYPHLALMPDAHLGKGATVGSVIPTAGAIMPAAVGVDIGCGMIAVRTRYTKADVLTGGSLRELRESIERAIPLSAGRYNARVELDHTVQRVKTLEHSAELNGIDPDSYAANWRLQLGSLGSGNHFIEVTVDEIDGVWLFLHSGSRGIGNKIAQRHIRVAQQMCENAGIELPDRDLAYIADTTDEFHSYWRELKWAQRFAALNRDEMMDRLVAVFGEWMGGPVEELERISCHHNFTQQEVHFDRDLYVTRKGAIEAKVGQPGLIPGSMGTASYVVVGKGEPLSFNSAPHGAGREYSRSAAKRTFTHDQLVESMQGIEWSGSTAFLDEIPGAYKPIDRVMGDACDLVVLTHTLRQLVNVKGD